MVFLAQLCFCMYVSQPLIKDVYMTNMIYRSFYVIRQTLGRKFKQTFHSISTFDFNWLV